jgi:hypothetical protein
LENKVKKLLINLKLHYYNIVLIVEDFLNRLQGRKEYVSIDDTRQMIEVGQQNHKLRRGIEKLTRAIYDPESGLLRDLARDKDLDLMFLTEGTEKSTLEKVQEAQLTAKILANPTDNSKTDNAIVSHNVKSAPRYLLEKQRRELAKLRTKAMVADDLQESTRLTVLINGLTSQINQLKKQG